MINGAHVILYSTDAEADRVFIRDVLGFAGVDAGDGWLIFKLPPAEIAVHPTDGPSKSELFKTRIKRPVTNSGARIAYRAANAP